MDQVVTIRKYLKHPFSCLPDVAYEILIDHGRRLITISSKGFDSSLLGWLVTSLLPADTGITAYRDDDAGWVVPRPERDLRVRLESAGAGTAVEMMADIVKLSKAIGGGVAVRLMIPPQAQPEEATPS